MRRLGTRLAVVVLAAFAFAGCGGGGGGGGTPLPRLNPSEAALVGNYELIGFDLFIDGLWSSESSYSNWGGTMTLYPDLTGDVYEYVNSIGVVNIVDGFPWSATATTFTSGPNIATYTFNGSVFITAFIDPDTGDQEIDRWLRVP